MTTQVPHLFVIVHELFLQEFYPTDKFYCTLKLDKNTLKTNLQHEQWEEEFIFLTKKSSKKITIQVYFVEQNSKKGKFFGQTQIMLSSLASEKPVNDYFQLTTLEKPPTKCGRLKLTLHHVFSPYPLPDLKIEAQWRLIFPEFFELIASDNYELLNILIEVSNASENTQLASIIVSVLNSDEEVLKLTKQMIVKEVNLTNTSDQLFRTNSITTKIMKEFAFIRGRQFLINTLHSVINDLGKLDKEVKIDPTLQDEKELQENTVIVKEKTTYILENIFKSISKMPRVLKVMSLYIKNAVDEKFEGFGSQIVAGFIFLRFFCAAISAPEIYGIIDQMPSTLMRKNLVFLTKIIQTLANHVNIEERDSRIKILKDYFAQMTPLIDQFLESVCKVEDVEYSDEIQVPELTDFNSLIDLHQIFEENIDKIDAVLSPNFEQIDLEDNNNNNNSNNNNINTNQQKSEALKKNISLKSFLGSEDKVTTLAMLINEFGTPPKKAVKNLHSIPNNLILRKKALAITQMGSHDDEDESCKILNLEAVPFANPRDPNIIAEELVTQIHELYFRHLKMDPKEEIQQKQPETKGRQLLFPECNWEDLKNDPQYIEMKKTSLGELKSIMPQNLDKTKRVAFWLNIHNLMLINAFVENEGPPLVMWEMNRFVTSNKYKVGNLSYSIDDIAQGILRANPKNFFGARYFKRNDIRRHDCLSTFSPILLFGITSFQLSAPQLFVFKPDNIELQLYRAAQIFIESSVQLKDSTMDPIIWLPTWFKYYKSEFGKNDFDVVNFIVENLKIMQSDLFVKIRNLTVLDYSVNYKNIRLYPKNEPLFDSSSLKKIEKLEIPLIFSKKK
ncbi:ras gtpase-activating protein [Anaeramoeba ignava]|uniref:Ras gtpase-activating protein n=1 Tax=Anaeramoeba ignava TaxID=1746090 RepID=A0A9Q0R938_ANAIG|nr:ras gtpase-activating protein [Anaeramoeba ignava]